MGWLAGWDERQIIVVDGTSAGEQIDYTIEVSVTHETEMQADFDDVRFTDSDGTTELNYWLETKVDSTSATFWTKVPTIPASPDSVNIYMYYGNVGASSNSDIFATHIDGDDFNRANLSETQPWTKSGSNPLTGYGKGDPFPWFEGSTFYIFADSFTGGGLQGLELFTAPDSDPADFTSQGTILALGSGGSWDDHWVADPHIVKVGSTYHMFYSGADGTGVTGIKIGHATSSTIDGTYTKDGSNPVFSKASNGTNEPSISHDGSTFHMTYTYAASGSATDVAHQNVGYATSSDGTTWSDQGQIMSGNAPQNDYAVYGGDQFHIQDGNGLWHMFVNDGGSPVTSEGFLYQATAEDIAGPWTPIGQGGVIAVGASYDDVAVWAPSIVLVSGTYYMYYQGQDGTGARLALATGSTLSNDYRIWKEEDFTGAFTISSNRFFKTSGDATWNRAQSQGPLKEPSYTLEADIEFSAYSGSGYAFGVYIAKDATDNWLVAFNLDTDTMALWRINEGSFEDTTAAHTLDTGANGYKIRAIVEAGDIQIDWYDGASWNANALSTTGQTLTEAAGGFYGFGTSANQFYADNFRVRKFADPEPSVAAPVAESQFPRHGASTFEGVAII